MPSAAIEPMKKKLKLSVIITASVLAAVAVVAIVLSVVKINPLKRLPADYTVTVYQPSSEEAMAYNDDTVAAVKKGIDDSSFSIMHALLEYRYDYSFAFKTEKNEDGDKVRVKLYNKSIDGKPTIKDYMSAQENSYMLELSYAAPQTVKVGKEKITFDRVRFLVADMSGEVEKVEMLFYEYGKTIGDPADEYYYVTPVTVWMSTTKLFNALNGLSDML